MTTLEFIGLAMLTLGACSFLMIVIASLYLRERWHECSWCGQYVSQLGNTRTDRPQPSELSPDKLLCQSCARSRDQAEKTIITNYYRHNPIHS